MTPRRARDSRTILAAHQVDSLTLVLTAAPAAGGVARVLGRMRLEGSASGSSAPRSVALRGPLTAPAAEEWSTALRLDAIHDETPEQWLVLLGGRPTPPGTGTTEDRVSGSGGDDETSSRAGVLAGGTGTSSPDMRPAAAGASAPSPSRLTIRRGSLGSRPARQSMPPVPPSVRVRLQVDCMHLRPLAMYDELLASLAASPRLVAVLLEAAPAVERTEFAQALLAILGAHGKRPEVEEETMQ